MLEILGNHRGGVLRSAAQNSAVFLNLSYLGSPPFRKDVGDFHRYGFTVRTCARSIVMAFVQQGEGGPF